jgi:anti-sigma regulatory factor (Ser/Thr protein kinase)
MEMTSCHTVISVTESSQTAAARAAARELAAASSFDETDAHRAGLVATELATNLVKHTGGGELLLRRVAGGPAGAIELIAIDRGPGIRDVSLALSDGHSTRGSPGTGLGAIGRLSDDFDLYSQVGRGTVVLARLRARRTTVGAAAMRVGVVSVPKTGERVCGDGWTVRYDADGLTLMVADGLGHGPLAAEAAQTAMARFDSGARGDVAASLQDIHDALRHTRGAAAAIANIHPRKGVVRYGGVGNISAAVVHDGAVRQAVSHNGTLGYEARRFREYTYPWAHDALLLVHTDGLTSRWSLDEYPGVRRRDASLVAALLYRDHSRGRDDVTIVVAREAA